MDSRVVPVFFEEVVVTQIQRAIQVFILAEPSFWEVESVKILLGAVVEPFLKKNWALWDVGYSFTEGCHI